MEGHNSGTRGAARLAAATQPRCVGRRMQLIATLLALLGAAGARQTAAAAAAPELRPAAYQWSQVGEKMSRERVTAISMDFGPDGFPVFACGWNSTDVGTRIPVMACRVCCVVLRLAEARWAQAAHLVWARRFV